MITISPAGARRLLSPILSPATATPMFQWASDGRQPFDSFIGQRPHLRGSFGAGRLASRLKELESVDLIGPWHVGHWIDYTHTAIRIRFSSPADARAALSNVGFSAGSPLKRIEVSSGMSHLLSKACSAPALKEHDDVGTMVAQFGWRHMFAACGIATAVAVIALSVSGLPWAFDFVQAGSTSHRFTNPRHDPAAYHPPSNAIDPFHDKTEMGGRASGQH